MAFKKFKDYNALRTAIKAQQLDIVDQLLKNGANPNYVPLFGPRILEVAIENGTPEILKAVLKHIDDPNEKTNPRTYDKITALFTAISENKPEMVEVLLKDPRITILNNRYISIPWGPMEGGGADYIKAPCAYEFALEQNHQDVIDTFDRIRGTDIQTYLKRKKASNNPKPPSQ